MMTDSKMFFHRENLVRVCQKLVENANADFLCGCQVGGFRKGFLEEDFEDVAVLVSRGIEIAMDVDRSCEDPGDKKEFYRLLEGDPKFVGAVKELKDDVYDMVDRFHMPGL